MTEDNTKIIQVRVSISDAEALDRLVATKKYISVSDVARVAIRDLIRRET